MIRGTDTNLDAITWNLEQFPLDNNETVKVTADLIKRMDVDIIAVQEIKSAASFEMLIDLLPGWSGEVYASSNLNLGFLYKNSEIEIAKMPFPIYQGEPSPFPREPLLVEVKHTNGLSLTFINIHLKCCSGASNEIRRANASRLLKEYLDTNLPNDKVVLLGDFNDLIIEENPDDNVFLNFLTDSMNYKFATEEIAKGPSSEWSYPSWPSHIDQILISDELFDHLEEVKTIKFDACDTRYSTLVSDHRPVYFNLKAD